MLFFITGYLHTPTYYRTFCAITGYQWSDIADCVDWMSSFVATLNDAGPVDLKFFNRVSASETHNIQTHVVNVSLLVSEILSCYM